MTNDQGSNDLFSRFMNWLNQIGDEKPEINHEEGGKDFLSRFMNRFSD